MDTKRVILIVLDSFGIGALPDAHRYADEGCNTFRNIVGKVGMPYIPNMTKLGIGHIDGIDFVDFKGEGIGSFGRLNERSMGKDTTVGHWEIAGIHTKKAFPVYPDGFPKEVTDELKSQIGTSILANCSSSGTQIIDQYGEEHIQTGFPIVYTSADSVFQIAAHEEVIPVERLYGICSIARELLNGEHAVGRVIARPFIGEAGAFVRTNNRKDYSLTPPVATVLDEVANLGKDVIGVGKISDIFAGQGLTAAIHSSGNRDGIWKTIELIKENNEGLIFTNLVDFDMLYGHRNDAEGYKKALEEFDRYLPGIMKAMKDTDVLMITADHGCDPTTPGTDHSREAIPLLVYGKTIKAGVNLGTRNTFSDIAATIAEIFQSDDRYEASSFLQELRC